MKSRIGQLEVSNSARGIPKYRLVVEHTGLKKHRVVSGDSRQVVLRKAELQAQEWEQRWNEVVAREELRNSKEAKKLELEEKKQTAADLTAEATRQQQELQEILKHTIDIDDAIDFSALKDRSTFPEAAPTMPKKLSPPQPTRRPEQPVDTDQKYQPRFGFLDYLIPSRKTDKLNRLKQQFAGDLARWQEQENALAEADESAMRDFENAQKLANELYEQSLSNWNKRKASFVSEQRDANDAIDELAARYHDRDPDAILQYCDMVLHASEYPEYFPQSFELEYNPDNRILIVDYSLPSPDLMPRVKAIKYVASRDEFEEQIIADSQVLKTYDTVLYQVAIRTIHELFEADVVDAVDTVVLNGFVTSIDKSTGNEGTACVLSVQARKEDFLKINLASVDPKACFKALKGVGSSKLHGLAPVAPIVQLRKDDSRFIAAHDVADSLDATFNLATMDWEEFEHLIRELFEKEFSSSGGEVKVTQASRDGGVDAVAFDPDPIRGGKIVIQAKRYAHTVGVGAVRDLYGTVLNEGANKGILVTTSDYGPDSYSFANGKPLVLLNGANLLHMLEKHGHKARIDLKEARQVEKNQ